MSHDYDWSWIALLPAMLYAVLLVGVIANGVYEFATCRSRVFVDPGHHRMMYCVVDPAELARLKPYLHNK